MKLPKLSQEEQKQFNQGVVKVDGSAMNRTALGIIAAYFKLYPKATFSELKEDFPDSLNPSGPRAPKSIFKPFTNRDFGVVHSLEAIKSEFEKAGLSYDGMFFTEPEEMFKTSDGVTVIVNKLWQSEDLETGESDLVVLARRALTLGIYVDKFEFTKAFGKGSYNIEILQPELYEKITKGKKKTYCWLWIIIVLWLLLAILWAAGVFQKNEDVPVQKNTTEVKIEKKEVAEKPQPIRLNNVCFKTKKYNLLPESYPELERLVKHMNDYRGIQIELHGHTDDVGTSESNMILSNNRAKAVKNFLVDKSIEETRVQTKGFGEDKPIETNKTKEGRAANRRVEFVIVQSN